MVTNFTSKTLLLGTVIAGLAAVAYFFIKGDGKYEEKHEKCLKELQAEGQKLK